MQRGRPRFSLRRNVPKHRPDSAFSVPEIVCVQSVGVSRFGQPQLIAPSLRRALARAVNDSLRSERARPYRDIRARCDGGRLPSFGSRSSRRADESAAKHGEGSARDVTPGGSRRWTRARSRPQPGGRGQSWARNLRGPPRRHGFPVLDRPAVTARPFYSLCMIAPEPGRPEQEMRFGAMPAPFLLAFKVWSHGT